MLNNPPEVVHGYLPAVSPPSQTPDKSKYPFLGDLDYAGSKYHRWLQSFDIGLISYTGSNSIAIAQGLANGQSMTVNVDQVPDRFIVIVWGEGAAGVAANYGVRIARVSLGSASTGGFQLGPGGKLKIPAQGHNHLTITNIATATLTLHGSVLAIGGFDLSDIDVG